MRPAWKPTSSPQSPRLESNQLLNFTKVARHHVRFRGTSSAHGQMGWSRPVLIQVPSREPSVLSRREESNPRGRLGRPEPNHYATPASESAQRDSNPRPLPWQGNAKPTQLCAHVVEADPGVEPGTTILQTAVFPFDQSAVAPLRESNPARRPARLRGASTNPGQRGEGESRTLGAFARRLSRPL